MEVLSKTIKHLESYNKKLNVATFLEEVAKAGVPENNEVFLKTLFRAVHKSNPVLRQKPVDYERTFAQFGDEQYQELLKSYLVCHLIGDWLEFKQIYKFDLDTLKLILEGKGIEIGYHELKALQMPYNCFVIENEVGDVDSIIVRRKQRDDGAVVLSIYSFAKGMEETILPIDITLKENQTVGEYIKDWESDNKELVASVLKLVLYLCQPKMEVIKKKGESLLNPNKKDKPIKHFYKVDYEENEVGCKIGSAIRQYKVVYEKGEAPLTPNQKRNVKPHMRAGHFHHYWTGKGRTDLIVKYVEPTFVLGGSKIATLHNVKNK